MSTHDTGTGGIVEVELLKQQKKLFLGRFPMTLQNILSEVAEGVSGVRGEHKYENKYSSYHTELKKDEDQEKYITFYFFSLL